MESAPADGRYGVDGYKFDAGDVYFYQDSDRSHVPMLAREQTAVFNEAGSHYSLNEFRAAWKFGGQAHCGPASR